MKKRIICFLLAAVLLIGVVPTAFAADSATERNADALHQLGLFSGTGVDADGKPIYSLDRVPTRSEAITMLVRLLGKQSEAEAGTWENGFTDVADWAKPYVGYAYANGLSTGTSATTFGGNSSVTAAQFITFILRALGYESGTDFDWKESYRFSDSIGLTNKEYNGQTKSFTRGDAVNICASALKTNIKDTNVTLLQTLVNAGIISADNAEVFLSSNLPTYEEMEKKGIQEVSISFVQKSGKLYKIENARSKDKLLLYENELYCPANLKEYTYRVSGKTETGYGCYQLGDVIGYAIGRSNMLPHVSKFYDGMISTKNGKGNEYPTVSSVKKIEISAKKTMATWMLSGNGQSYYVDGQTNVKGMYLQNSVRTIRTGTHCYVNLNDMLKLFGHTVRVSYLEKAENYEESEIGNILICTD